VVLRPWSEDDLECIRDAGTDPEITSDTTVPSTYTQEEGLSFVHRQWSRALTGYGVSLAIALEESDRAVGLAIVVMRPQPGVVGLGYWVAPSDRGNGFATAAVRLLAPWALTALEMNRVEAWVVPGNVASQVVLTRGGFVREGVLRNFFTRPDGVSDAIAYSLIP
jgi:RimJ/RimL family protein N-acetyltransferase